MLEAMPKKNLQKLKLGIPKGSLQEITVEIFKSAGFKIQIDERSYKPFVDDIELDIRLMRPQEIPRYVRLGNLDCGLTGTDWLLESGAKGKVVEVADLIYGRSGLKPVKWVLAVPDSSPIKKVSQLSGKRIATELVRVTKSYLKQHNVANAEVEFSWGATEAKPPEFADAIVELTETGTTLLANNLRILDVVLESNTKLIANKIAYRNPWKRQKMESLAILLLGALEARHKVGIKLNAPKERLKDIVKLLPALKRPTISELYEPGWVAVESIVDEDIIKELIPKLKRAGAQGIVEYSLNKVIY